MRGAYNHGELNYMIKTILLASTLIAGGAIAAQAQSTSTPSASDADRVSSATHCKDSATGLVRLKSDGTSASNSSTASSSTTGSGTSQANSMNSNASGSTGLNTADAEMSEPSSVSAALPNC